MTQTQAVEIPLGEFPLASSVASYADIRSAYEDDREIEIGFSGTTVNNNYRAKAVLRLHDSDGLRGHTTEPEGYNLRVFHNNGTPFVEVTSRKSA